MPTPLYAQIVEAWKRNPEATSGDLYAALIHITRIEWPRENVLRDALQTVFQHGLGVLTRGREISLITAPGTRDIYSQPMPLVLAAAQVEAEMARRHERKNLAYSEVVGEGVDILKFDKAMDERDPDAGALGYIPPVKLADVRRAGTPGRPRAQGSEDPLA